MSSGSVTTAALRHRPLQAALIVALSAVVGACAVAAPAYARAVEESVLRTVVGSSAPAEHALQVSASGQRPPSPHRLARVTRAQLPERLRLPAVGGAAVRLSQPAPLRLVSRDRLCAHVLLATGRCPTAAGEVLVDAAATTGPQPGQRIDLGQATPLVVVGSYRLRNPTGRYWSLPGTRLEPGDLLTSWATLAAGDWPSMTTHVALAVRATALRTSDQALLRALPERVAAAVRPLGAESSTALPQAVDRAEQQQAQSARLVRLLGLQLGVLGLVVLGFVAAATIEQRRPELALVRLRGQGTAGAAGLLARELGLLVSAGTGLGAGLGLLAAWLAASLLTPGAGARADGSTWLAAAVAGMAGWAAVAVTGAPTLRQPVVALLRRVPPRVAGWQVGLVEAALAAAALAGTISLLTTDRGPVAVLAPGLLAVAGGLLLAGGVGPAAAGLSALLLRGGKVAATVAALQVARRPGLRRLIAIVAVAVALLVFATDVWSVARRNREVRAASDVGAPVVLTVDAPGARQLQAAVHEADPRGRDATPVVELSGARDEGTRTLAVQPQGFARVASWPGGTPPGLLGRLTRRVADPLVLRGTEVEVSAAAELAAFELGVGRPPRPPRPVTLSLQVLVGDQLREITLGRLPAGRHTLRAPAPCADGCRLHRIVTTRNTDEARSQGLELRLRLLGLRVRGGGEWTELSLGTGTATQWQFVPEDLALGPTGRFLTSAGLGLVDTPTRTTVLQHAALPYHPPALVAGAVPDAPRFDPAEPRRVLAYDLSGAERAFDRVGRLPRLPGVGRGAVLTPLDPLLVGAEPSLAAVTRYQVWLADASAEREVRESLRHRGIRVFGRETTDGRRDALDVEGPALALRFGLLAGVTAVLLAASVLVLAAVTSGPARVRDLAALRLVGVSGEVVRAAAVREHVCIALVGSAAGTALGLVAAGLALPRLPLFATRAAGVPLDLGTAWVAALSAALLATALLTAVAVAVGRRLGAAATPQRVRETMR